MRHTLLSLLLFAGGIFAQGTPSVQFTQSFTAAASGSAISNGPTTSGGPQGSVAFRLVYWIQAGSGTVSALSVELDGASTSTGSYTALTPAVGGGSGSGSTTNPVTSFPNGQNVTCCDYWPFLKIKVNTITVASGTPILIVKVLGYAGTSAAAGTGGGGGGTTCITGDVTAGSGSGCLSATVVGLESVPFCAGYTPTNGQFVQYTTGGSPNPCYSAAAGGSSSGPHGTASFNASAGSIGSLIVTGCITGVTYVSTGHYNVAISACPANYLVIWGFGDDGLVPTGQVSPIASYGTTGFSGEVLSGGGAIFADPHMVWILIP